MVLGPRAVPVIRDVEVAKRDLELVVLSAMAHGKEEVGLQIATAVLKACRGLHDERSLLYLDLIGGSLNHIARAAFEDLMASNYEFQGTLAKKHRAEGRAEGEARGEARGVLKVLAARGIKVSDGQKERILACTDLAVLDRWIERAVTVTSVDALFTD